MILTFFGLTISLKTELHFVQDVCYRLATNRKTFTAQKVSDIADALAGPAQRRFWVTTRTGLDHLLYEFAYFRCGNNELFPPSTIPTNTLSSSIADRDFSDTAPNGVLAYTGHLGKKVDATVSKRNSLRSKKQAPLFFIKSR
jgi:hypothetical protein